MNKLILTVAVGLSLHSSLKGQAQIDHVIITTNNLSATIQYYDSLGFNVVKGRDHVNGLRNAFIKLSKGSEIEIMSLTTDPVDELSQTYHTLLQQGISGAFLCLTGKLAEIQDILSSSNIAYKLTTEKGWSYITFPDPELAHFFFIFYQTERRASALSTHPNGASDINQVVIDENSSSQNLFNVLFLERFVGNSIKTASGDILLLEPNKSTGRPVVRSIVLNTNSAQTIVLDLKPLGSGQ
jgi:catechol 2,3-dioxygenase-like lactoylglutathione lyase family enzyme